MTVRANWSYPTRVWLGAGRLAELPAAAAELGMSRPLLVTDPGLARLPVTAAALDHCQKAGLTVTAFSAIKGNPSGANVEAGLDAYRSGGHDGIIAFGGGSALDAAKAVALVANQQGRALWDFVDEGDNWRRADPARIVPTIAVPTTAGTGSEVGRASVITDEAAGVKRIIFHPGMMPGVVILDPEVTVGLPAGLTAATGIDALTHSLEAFCAPGYHPMSRGIAVEGIRLVAGYLGRAFRDGTDIEARGQMLVASAMGAVAFQRGLGATHALSHALGAIYDAHHGLLNAVIMPYVLVRNRDAIEDEIAYLARALGLDSASFDGFLDWLLRLREEMAIPHALSAIGIGLDKLDTVARVAAVDAAGTTNPIPLDAASYGDLFRRAVGGDLG
jgi:alcohol dehydrogenase class IV